MTARPRRHPRWPAERCYWAELDVSVLPRAHRRSPEHCGYLFEAHLPVSIDEVQAVYARAPGERVIACGVERSELDRGLEPPWRTLTPASVPGAIVGDAAVDPRRLNLLVGDYLPEDARRGARLSLLQVAVAAAAIVVLAVIGVHRRATAMESAHEGIEAEVTALLAGATGREATSSVERSMQQTRLEIRLEELRRTRRGGVVEAQLVDAARTLARVLAVWPEEAGAKVELFNVAAEAVVVRGVLPDSEALGAVVAALEALDGWKIQYPDSTAEADGLSVVLRLQRRTEDGA